MTTAKKQSPAIVECFFDLGKKQLPLPVPTLQIKVICLLITYVKKLLGSDWLRAVQFKCSTTAKKCNISAKSVTPVQITHRNSES